MKTICIYHSNCLDGFASAFIIWKTLGPKVEFIPAVYGKEPPWELLADSEVYIVDFSYPADIMAKICEQAHYVTVIDHHESAIRKLAGFSAENYTAKFDITRAGTELTHEFFFGDREMHPILQMLANRDLWNFSLPGTKEICAAMWEEDRTFERWDSLISSDYHKAFLALHSTGSIILKMNARNIESLLRSGTRQIPGTTIPICNMPFMYASEAGNILAQDIHFQLPISIVQIAGNILSELQTEISMLRNWLKCTEVEGTKKQPDLLPHSLLFPTEFHLVSHIQ